MATILHHDDIIEVNGIFGHVGTVEGFSAGNTFTTPEQALERARKNGHDIAWAIQQSATITTSRAFYAKQAEERARAIRLTEGEAVEIEGRPYTVKFVNARVSDFVKFIPA